MSLQNLAKKVAEKAKKAVIDSFLTPEKLTPVLLQVINNFLDYGEKERVYRIQRTYCAISPTNPENGSTDIVVMEFDAITHKKIDTITLDKFLAKIFSKLPKVAGFDAIKISEKIHSILIEIMDNHLIYYLIGRSKKTVGKFFDIEILPVEISQGVDSENGFEVTNHFPKTEIYISEILPGIIDSAKAHGFLDNMQEIAAAAEQENSDPESV